MHYATKQCIVCVVSHYITINYERAVLKLSSVGKHIRALRRGRGLTQEQLSQQLGVKRSTIACYETDTRLINLEDLIKLASFFNVGLDYFGVTEDKSEIIDLLSRARVLFESPQLSDKEKEDLHHELLKVYLEIKTQK